jgi:ferredoxin
MQVTIVEGCIACGVCESLCPEVFRVIDTAEADNAQVPGHELECREAATACPVSVIKIQE